MSSYNVKSNKFKKDFGKHLRSIRLDNALTQLDLATKCDLEATTISRIESGRTNISLKTLLTLAKGLSIAPSKLVEVFN